MAKTTDGKGREVRARLVVPGLGTGVVVEGRTERGEVRYFAYWDGGCWSNGEGERSYRTQLGAIRALAADVDPDGENAMCFDPGGGA